MDQSWKMSVSHLPVTLLEPACGDVSIFPVLYLGRGREKETNHCSIWHSVWIEATGKFPKQQCHEIRSSIAAGAGDSWRVPGGCLVVLRAAVVQTRTGHTLAVPKYTSRASLFNYANLHRAHHHISNCCNLYKIEMKHIRAQGNR